MVELKKNVLVVDDDASVREFLTYTLNDNGFHALAAKDGVEALRLVDSSQNPIDILLIDMVMPRLDGKELARTIQSHHPETKINLISGYPEHYLAQNGISTENILCLKKPFTTISLLDTIREELNQKNSIALKG